MRKVQTEKRVTLQDIAKETGYSINTVSRALRNKSDISPETCQSIQRVASRMGYSINQIASSLRSGRTHIFAVILGGMSNPFYGIMADTIQNAAKEKGYSLIIMCSRDNADLELELVEQAISRCVDGVLLFPTSNSRPTIDRLKASRMPFVLMSRYLQEDEADCVVCDEMKGAYLATQHLIEAGRRKLAFISSRSVLYSSDMRLLGFQQACDDADIPITDQCVFVSSRNIIEHDQLASWYELLIEKLKSLKASGFDGLFVFCDVEAWHVVSAIQKSGTIRKDDFGIVSFDNLEGSLSYPISLCSVECNFEMMAKAGVRILRDRIHGDTQPPVKIVCPVSLVCRDSCLKK